MAVIRARASIGFFKRQFGRKVIPLQSRLFLFLLVQEALAQAMTSCVASSAHPFLSHRSAPFPGPPPSLPPPPQSPRRLRASRPYPPAGGGPRFSVLRGQTLAPLLPQPLPKLRPGYASLATSCPWQQEDAGPEAGFPARSYPCVLRGAGRAMSEILCQWLNQELKVSQTVSE